MARWGTISDKEATQVSRGLLGWIGNAYRLGDRLKGISLDANFKPMIAFGTSAAPVTLATYENHGAAIYTTSASTDASNSVEAMYVKSVMTGAAGVGGRSRFHLYTNVALGGWCNALKGFMEFGASGRVTGLASVFCADLELSVGTVSGSYTVYEANIIADAAVSTGTLTSFARFNIAGTNSTGKTTLNTNGYLFDLGEGIVDTASGLIDSASITATNFTHRIRIRALGVDMWFGVHTDPDFTT